MIKHYSGIIRLSSHGEADEILFVGEDRSDNDPLAELIQGDMLEYGEYLSVRYFITGKSMSFDECEEALIRTLYGDSDVKFYHRYSEITGYLWTDEDIMVGGHDLLAEIKSHVGKYVLLEIDFNKVPEKYK